MRTLKEKMTVGEVMELIAEALSLTGEPQKELVDALLATGPKARENIGYLSGYLTPEKAKAVLELFGTEHPVFGKTQPTPEEAYAAGLAIGQKRGGWGAKG